MKNSLPVKNLINRPGRTVALGLLTAFLSFAALGGSLFVNGLQSGLSSLKTRLGADIMVVPYEASTKSSLSDIILQGNPGSFYMDASVVDKISQMDGIGELSTQFYLASSTASCCSTSVQIIGFDPETDFTILPWAAASYKEELGYMQVLVGNNLNAFSGDTLTFFGTDVTVAARLDSTGTYLDTAVYASKETIQTLISQAMELQVYNFGDIDPYDVVSCVLINVADGYTVEDVLNDINIHVRGVEAVQTSTLLSSVSDKLTGISGIIGWLVSAIWILALVILIIIFVMISNERKKEFAILRALGASKSKLTGLVMKETLIICSIGSVAGAAAALLALLTLEGTIEGVINLPFLLPQAAGMLILIVISIAAAILAGTLSCAASVRRISNVDTALILRGEN